MEQLVAVDFLDLAGIEFLDREGSVGNANEARDFEAEMAEHVTHFAVLALGQRQLDPLVMPGRPLEVDRAPRVFIVTNNYRGSS